MAVQAGQLARLKGEQARLSPLDVARLYAGTATAILLTEYGDQAAVEFLRELADGIEAGKPAAN